MKQIGTFLFAVLFIFWSTQSCIDQKSNESDSPFVDSTSQFQETITLDVLVIPSRNHTRMQPEIFYAMMTSGKNVQPVLHFEFALFNPFLPNSDENDALVTQELMDELKQTVSELIALKQNHRSTHQLFQLILNDIHVHPKSHLAIVWKTIREILSGYQMLIIESSDTYGIHPVFYRPDIVEVDLPEGASAEDIIEALYGLLFLEAALEDEIPVWGSCHGAQLGYIHAGGTLDRLFEYKEGGYPDVAFRKKAPKHINEEVWHIDDMLYTQEPGSNYLKSGITVYPLPDIFKPDGRRQEELYINKDFQHSLAMTPPIPEQIKVISFHPFSEYKSRRDDSGILAENKAFEEILKDQVLIDAYRYKTMLGVQYHPQYTYDDFETALIFDWLMNEIMQSYLPK